MQKLGFWLFAFLIIIFLALLAGPLAAEKFLIDNFEKGSITEKPKWWTFDAIKTEVVPAAKECPAYLEKYWLKLTGPAKDWYVGGLGCELRIDATPFDAVKMDVLGNGPRSGRLKIELYDDDNNNEQIEQDESRNFAPIYDDRWVYEVKVDWTGWKTLTIPFSDFTDDNTGVGDDKFNPEKINNSAGLANFQIILVANSKTGSVDIGLDNLKFIKSAEK